jgi:endo-1,4-beta-xylanase
MHIRKHLLVAFASGFLASAATAANTPVIVQAEAATLGSNLTTGTLGSVNYVTAATTYTSVSASADVASTSITFPASGTYELYVRINVPVEAAASADSFFHGAGFNTGTVGSSWTWITLNNLASVGYTSGSDVVGTAGTAGTGVWKWVKISGIDTSSIYLSVPTWTRTRTFNFAGREAGLLIDKFAFGPLGVHFTVDQLDNATAGTTDTVDPDVPAGPELARGKSKFLGSGYSEDANQNINFTSYWNQVIPGNAGKWGSVESTRDTMNWTNLDACYNFAEDNGYPFMFHVLVWGSQQPTWLNALSNADKLAELEEWFDAVADRYENIDILQVVNEPLSAPPVDSSGAGGYKEALGGDGTTGWDWVIEAFTLAREYFPNTPLMINDYNIISDTSRADTYVTIINLLKERDLIDAIGIQGHGFSYAYASTSTINICLAKLTATGLPVYVTEMDVNGITDAYQLSEFQRVFPIFWENPDVLGVSMWGWRVGMWRSDQGCFLVDWNEQERPAMEWLRSYVQSYEDWHGFDVTDNWADTGDWLGRVYVGFNPWIYVEDSDSWIYMPNSYDVNGAWGYILYTERTVHDFTETAGTWLGFPVTSGWANTGLWLGNTLVTYSPWVFSDQFGWMYAFKETASNSGGWFWLQQ